MNIPQLGVFCIFGLQGCGKSTLMDFLARQGRRSVFLYDTLGESPPSAPYISYTPSDRYSVPELESVLSEVRESGLYKHIMIDEANRYAPSKPHPLPPVIADLTDQHRHYRLESIGYIARRPSQLNQDLTEVAKHLFLYRLTGKNDRQFLNDISTGLGDAVSLLDDYSFIIVYPNRKYKIQRPIKSSNAWLNRARHLLVKGLDKSVEV